jgi:phosphodiesterase/alkaline phosphatase D-like protein
MGDIIIRNNYITMLRFFHKKEKIMKILLLPVLVAAITWAADSRHLQGEKSGEVSHNSAILFTRTTQENSSANLDISGKSAKVRFEYADNPEFKKSMHTEWKTTQAFDDFHCKVKVKSLKPWTRYYYRVQIREGDYKGPVRSFRTAPASNQKKDVSFVLVTGQKYFGTDCKEGYIGYKSMLKVKPDFIFLTGDNVYYDSEYPRAIDRGTMRFHWHRMYALTSLIDLYGQVPGYWTKDDHDYRWDDADPFQRHIESWKTKPRPQVWPLPEPTNRPSHEEGVKIFIEQNPVDRATPYRSFKWGRGLEIFITEGRDFRSANSMEDGPDKTLWGIEQRGWLKKSLLESKAMFKVLCSPSPLIGPDKDETMRKGAHMKRDNHVNSQGFRYEGQELPLPRRTRPKRCRPTRVSTCASTTCPRGF